MFDITINAGDFNATEAEATPNTIFGMEFFESSFGEGCCSVTIRKSYILYFCNKLDEKGFTYEIV